MSQIEYFAIPNLDQPNQMTMWYQPEGCLAAPWPARTHYGPLLLKTDVPRGLHGEAKARWVNNWYVTVYNPWRDRMRAVIDADPVSAAGRYAAINNRCCCCNRHLKDPESLRIGAGPDCRDDWPATAIELLTTATTRARTELETQP